MAVKPKLKRNIYARLSPLALCMEKERSEVVKYIQRWTLKTPISRCVGEMMSVVPMQFEDAPIGVIGSEVHFWDGRVYVPMSRSLFNYYVYRFLVSCEVSKRPEVFNSVRTIQDACYDVVMGHALTVNESLFVFANGIYDLESKVFTKVFSPDKVQTFICDYEYFKCEPIMWRAFLSKVLPSQNAQDTLQMFLGAALMSRKEAKIEKMLVLYGSGANGKSVVCETVKGVFGRQNVSEYGLNMFMDMNEGGNTVAMCNGKRLNYSDEIRAFFGRDANDDMLKQLISGEPMTVRGKYKDGGMTADKLPLMMANTNWRIKDLDMSNALRRRIRQIDFSVTIPIELQDRRLAKSMRREYAGIFDWIVEGMEKFRGNDYKFPEEENPPTQKEDCEKRKKLFATNIGDVVKYYLNHNKMRYVYNGSSTRTSKVAVKVTDMINDVKEYAEDNGYTILGTNGKSMTRKQWISVFTDMGMTLYKRSGVDFTHLYATTEDARIYRNSHK